MHKAGFVNIVGNPNVGKSTLMNQLVGERISIATFKAQTTRHRIMGIVNTDDMQIVFSDTPGVLKPNYKLQESMLAFSESALADADVLLYVTDVVEKPEKNMDFLEKVQKMKKPVILLINKIDVLGTDNSGQEKNVENSKPTHKSSPQNAQRSARLRQETLSKQSEERTLNAQRSTLNAQHPNLTTTLGDIVELWHKLLPNAEILPISAKNKFGTEILLKRIKELLPESPAFFDKDQLTDKPARFFVSEIIREKILLYYDKEIPYSVEVAVESFKESEKIIRISAVIYVERDSQKGIIIGHQGIALKKMSTEARKSLERFFDKSIYLECFVKVDKDWRSSQRELNNFGYNPG
ncbi:GTPase Era [Prevotella koreensis]|uniref:GTPase Era n=1 Tax=Prevotella koreensis TaxID=2490854 RepID=UPI0028E8B78B|nr:GTPase Era [Prevotella koreensis]